MVNFYVHPGMARIVKAKIIHDDKNSRGSNGHRPVEGNSENYHRLNKKTE